MNIEEKEKRIERVEEILRSIGIEMVIGACGCCESPWVTFVYQGETLFDMEGRVEINTKKTKDKER